MKQEQPAAAVGVSVNTIKRIQAMDGTTPVHLETVRKSDCVHDTAVEFTSGDQPSARLRCKPGSGA